MSWEDNAIGGWGGLPIDCFFASGCGSSVDRPLFNVEREEVSVSFGSTDIPVPSAYWFFLAAGMDLVGTFDSVDGTTAGA